MCITEKSYTIVYWHKKKLKNYQNFVDIPLFCTIS